MTLSPTRPSRLDALIERARERPPLKTAVVFPNDATALRAAIIGFTGRLMEPVLYGSQVKIERIAQEISTKLDMVVVDTGDSREAAARAAVRATRAGAHDALMKGSLRTDELLSAVLNAREGLRGERRLTHTFVFDAPRYHKLFAVTDAVVNIAPDAIIKAEALANALMVMRALGVAQPKAAVIAAVETRNEAIRATTDASILVQWVKSGRLHELGNAIVEGPLGFDNAMSAIAARTKGIDSIVSGDPDVLLAPDLNAGNILYKSLIYLAGAECAGIVQGARVPIVLTSRADSEYSRLASVALASIMLD